MWGRMGGVVGWGMKTAEEAGNRGVKAAAPSLESKADRGMKTAEDAEDAEESWDQKQPLHDWSRKLTGG